MIGADSRLGSWRSSTNDEPEDDPEDEEAVDEDDEDDEVGWSSSGTSGCCRAGGGGGGAVGGGRVAAAVVAFRLRLSSLACWTTVVMGWHFRLAPDARHRRVTAALTGRGGGCGGGTAVSLLPTRLPPPEDWLRWGRVGGAALLLANTWLTEAAAAATAVLVESLFFIVCWIDPD